MVTSDAVFKYERISIPNSSDNSKYFYMLLNPVIIGSDKNGSYEFHIIQSRVGNSNSKMFVINFLSSYDSAEGQNILHCGIRNDISGVSAEIVKILYNSTKYYALKTLVYDWSNTIINYKYYTNYNSSLLFKVLTDAEISNEENVGTISLYQNGALLS